MDTLDIPQSDSIVRLQAIDAKTNMSLRLGRFMEPEIEGFDTVNFTSVCFLIDNEVLNKRILFDCGARKDFEAYSPATKDRLNAIIKGMTIEVDVNDVLVEANIDLNAIDSIVWSHWHWDHHGAPEKFPTSVEIVVGPGFKDNFMPGYPIDDKAHLLDDNFKDRSVREISFDDSSLRIGRLQAFDFFSDGSFYLLNTPGHAIGHVCGLARTTPSTFVFLGGDICHFYGMCRPSPGVQMPDPIPPGHLDDFFPSPCPCSVFTDIHPMAKGDKEKSRSAPFFNVTSTIPSSYHDRETAIESIRAMQDFDASPDVLVCIAHDPTLLKYLPVLNDQPDEDLNDWKSEGLKDKLLWGWLNDLPRDGKAGRPVLREAVWRDGERVTDFLKVRT